MDLSFHRMLAANAAEAMPGLRPLAWSQLCEKLAEAHVRRMRAIAVAVNEGRGAFGSFHAEQAANLAAIEARLIVDETSKHAVNHHPSADSKAAEGTGTMRREDGPGRPPRSSWEPR